MKKEKISVSKKVLDLSLIEGKLSAFERVPYALEAKLSKPLAKDGYGTVTVDGIPVSRGKTFSMDMIVHVNYLLVPIGEVAREYGREYTVCFTGFVAENGAPFQDLTVKVKTTERDKQDPAYREHDEAALAVARESIVLMKNEGNVLPIPKDSCLNLFGSGQYLLRNASTGAAAINPRWQANYHESIREHSSFSVNEEVSALYERLQDVTPSAEILEAAKKKSDTAILVISRCSGEFMDNRPIPGGYYLTEDEEAMIAAVSGSFEKTVAILNTGYPIDMRWTEKYSISSILYLGYPGQLGGYALMEILDGRVSPSGKLPDTWSFDYYDNPASKNFINLKAEDKIPAQDEFGVHLYYEEDIYVGYRYFDSFQKKAAFGFGHGLSYTEFDIRSKALEFENGRLALDAEVENKGERAGKEALQLYIHAPAGKLEKAERVLAAFEKTKLLQPGEKQSLTLTAEAMDFASFDETDGCYKLEEGEYTVYLGGSLESSRPVGSFTVTHTQILRQVNRIAQPVESFHRLKRAEPFVNADSKTVPLDERITHPAERKPYRVCERDAYRGPRIRWPMLKANPELLENFVSQMSDNELCKMNVCGGANWYLPWQNGAAGKTNLLSKYKLPRLLVSDGNPGLNIKKKNIGFPCSTNVAATFNKELAYTVGRVVGEESLENGIQLNLGPAMNIHRNILNGRHPEYFSEDPYLAGTLAGMHAKGLEDAGAGSCYKHLFCNNSDTARKASQSIVSEQALREIYFRVFEVALRIQKPSAMMTSYNSLNGIYPAENADILQSLLREEWVFDGFIMTDWGSYDTIDPVEIAKAGNSWLTEGSGKYVKILQKAVKDGRLSRAVLEENVTWLIKTMLKLV